MENSGRKANLVQVPRLKSTFYYIFIYQRRHNRMTVIRVYTIYYARMILIRIKMFSLDWLKASQNFMEKSPQEVKAHDIPNNFT